MQKYTQMRAPTSLCYVRSIRFITCYLNKSFDEVSSFIKSNLNRDSLSLASFKNRLWLYLGNNQGWPVLDTKRHNLGPEDDVRPSKG